MSAKWVDTDKTHGTKEPEVRPRWVARDFKNPNEKDREDLFSATPPIDMLRLMISRQATLRADGQERKTMYLDIKKAHLAPLCEQDVYVDLPEEAEVGPEERGMLTHWLYWLPTRSPGLGRALLGRPQRRVSSEIEVSTRRICS